MNKELRTIADKVMLTVYGLFFLVFTGGTPLFILSLFAATGLSYLSELMRSRWSEAVSALAYMVFVSFFPDGVAFLPLVSYEPCRRRLWAIPTVAAVFGYVFGGRLEISVAVVAGCAFCALIAGREAVLERHEDEVLEIRDVSSERRINLERENRKLQIAQDSEIYAATMAERNRIAREIHDNVGHVLSRAILMTGALSTINKDEALKRPLADIEASLDDAMNQLRASVHGLYDDSIDLREATELLVHDFHFCDITFDYDVSRYVPRDVKYCILTVLKEALTNIIRHSDATRAAVTVREHPAIYQLTVADNGTTVNKAKNRKRTDARTADVREAGVNTMQEQLASGSAAVVLAQEAGIGLINMRERVLGLGGRFSISTDDGFRIFMTLPKRKEA